MLIVAAALMVLGPPSRQRAEALDSRRIDDLRHIEEALRADYDVAKHPIPERLAEPKSDPVTAKPYEYRRLGPTEYTLCAVFERPSPSTGDKVLDDSPFWRHGAGRTCYAFDARREVMR